MEENISKSINEIKTDIAEIKMALQGSPLSGGNGISERVGRLENKMTDIEKFRWKVVGIYTVAVFVITYIVNKL